MIRKLLVLVVLALLGVSCGSSESAVPDPAPASTTVPSATAVEDTADREDTAESADDATDVADAAPTPTKTRDEETAPAANGPSVLGAVAPISGDIRDVDFFNDFTYPAGFDEEQAVTVQQGEYIDEPGYLWFTVLAVKYGDLDDDGTDEAVVQTGFNTGGSGQFGHLAVWDIVDGRVVERGSTGTGDRADGGLWHFEVRDGQLLTENFMTDQGACCPNMLTQQRIALLSDGLRYVEHVVPLRWMSLNNYDDPGTELKFLPGTSAAVVQLSSVDDTNELLFEAGAGQWVTTSLRRGPEAGVVILDDDGEVVGQSANTRLATQLPSSGFFRVMFTNSVGSDDENPGPSTVVDLAITGTELPPAPTWTPAVRELIVDDDPTVRLLTMTPEFDLSDNGRLNGAIEQWMGSQTDWWVADVIEYPPVEREGSDDSTGGEYELLYDVTLVADDLASFRWNWYEYVCCRPRPNTGHASLVVDLAERRIIEVDEILDLDRLDEIHDIWIAQAAAEEILPDDYLVWWGVDGPAFSSLALTPAGVEFGTDRLGAIGPTTTVVPYRDLGDLVSEDLVARARTGIEPTRLAAPTGGVADSP